MVVSIWLYPSRIAERMSWRVRRSAVFEVESLLVLVDCLLGLDVSGLLGRYDLGLWQRVFI